MKFYRAFVRYTDPDYYGSHGFLSEDIFVHENEALSWWKRKREFEEHMIKVDTEDFKILGIEPHRHRQKFLDCTILVGLTEIDVIGLGEIR